MISTYGCQFRLLSLTILSVFVAGCTVAGLSGSSAMRVEVEVYNGPLARSIEAQEAELEAAIKHTKDVFKSLEHEMVLSQCHLGCFKGEKGFDSELKCKVIRTNEGSNVSPVQSPAQIEDEAAETSYVFEVQKEDETEQVCPVLHGLERDAKSIAKTAGDIEKKFNLSNKTTHQSGRGSGYHQMATDIDLYRKAARLGHLLRSKGEFWATQNIGIVPDSTRTRIGLVHFTNGAAELGNEIAARADALVRQHSHNLQGLGIARELLPTSLYLRDSGGTDYLNLTDWFRASVKRDESFLTETDRVRILQRLITDTHWSKVNTVFASGQGEVRMALIKDDIGNWNLKSFESDPSKLLDAYKNVGLAAVSAAAGLASGGNTNAFKKAMSFANKVALGEESGGGSGLDVDSLHKYTRSRLVSLQEEQRRRLIVLQSTIAEAEKQVESARKDKMLESETLVTARTERDQKSEQIKNALVDLGKLEERRRQIEAESTEAKKEIEDYKKEIEAQKEDFRKFRDPIDDDIKRREGRISVLEEQGGREAEVEKLKAENEQSKNEIKNRMEKKEVKTKELEKLISAAKERANVESILNEHDKKITTQKKTVGDLNAELIILQATYDKAVAADHLIREKKQKKLEEAEKRLLELNIKRDGIPEETREQAITILSNHSDLITALQKTIVE